MNAVSRDNEDLLYSEWVHAGKFVRITILSVISLFIILAVVISIFFPHAAIITVILLGSSSAGVLLIFWAYRGINIT